MRRSSAPSRRSFNPSVETSPKVKNPPVIENTPKININFNKTIFNIVWSKITTKKHKTWEGDGTLEVKEKCVILRDITGQVLGTSNTFKHEEIFLGNKMLVGSKEIEIQETINSSTYIPPKRKNLDENNDHNTKEKKKKTIGVFSPNLQLTTIPKMSPKMHSIKKEKILMNSTSSSSNFDLILPTPSFAHQWEHNINRKPLSEVKVAPSLVKKLRDHQKSGVIFLYECLLGFRNSNYFGAILADEMGLGKTLQCLTICHTLLKQGPYGGDRFIHRVLIVTPSSLTETWSNEINKWLVNERMFSYVVDVKHKPKQYSKNFHMPFVIVSYESLVNYCDDFESINFDILICDEGHRLKNNNNKTSISLKQLNIKRIILLTGTPIQNDLQEFFNLIDFVNPGILGNYQDYKYQYEIPICKSQTPDANEEIKLLGIQRAEELNKITSSFILRRSQSLNNEYLPKKREYIVFVKPSKLQQILLKEVMTWYENNQNDDSTKENNSLQIINLLKKICNHPALIRKITNKNNLIKQLEKCLPNWSEIGSFDSGKLLIIYEILQEILPQKTEKIILISNYTKTLDMIQGLCDHFEYKYLRLDGQTPTTERNTIVEKFNRKNCDSFVFLLSAKAGGVGLNLSAASRLILYDNDWNPATDLQAMSRIWRDGQTRDVKIYRLITTGTIEEKIFQRQIAKTTLGGCVMNLSNDINTMKFTKEELKNLFTIQENYDNCGIHESLNCNCSGNGEKFIENPIKNNEDDPFRIVLNSSSTEAKKSGQINELMAWEHYKPPIRVEFLKESSLLNAAENITFIFSNLTEFSRKNDNLLAN